ncbi:glycosyltransferase [Endozoicomonas sp. 4G]|uniref:CgeB family protein n=1 Tax=Endozoicomonas sp. 4G TaxID=2872754 RepID=UPI0020791E3B|nr:glycosyltransferase [Endozoicomonas sp. 4G]
MKQPLKIATIVDDITALYLDSAFNIKVIHASPIGWRWQLNFFKPDLLFVESAWRGYKDRWKRKIASYPDNDYYGLYKLVEWCNKKSIPTVFWNKEDPVHFDRFSKAVLPFRFIYTTDSNSLERYHRLPGKEASQINVLPFSVDPKTFKNANNATRDKSVAFAGGYYSNELPQRSKVTCELLRGLRSFDLVIYDRFWERHNKSSFPSEFNEYVTAGVSADKVPGLYKKHSLYLNINTVENSPTMLSRRVFELAASGACIISNPSLAMSNFFGDLILQVTNAKEAEIKARTLLEDHSLQTQISKALHNTVMEKHTWQHRLDQIRSDLGI